MTPTDEQQAIIDAAVTTPDNLLVSALAGAAKTSTLVMIAEALSKTSILCLAFNKRIAVEMEKRLPANCSSRTLNSIGHSAWSDTIGKRCIVDTSKNFKLLKDEIEKLPRPQRADAYDLMAETLDMISFAKTSGYVPNRVEQTRRLTDDDALFNALDPVPTELQFALVKAVMIRSIKAAFEGSLDFDDQILMPTVFSAVFPRFPLVMVDETQDLSELNHAMLKKLVRQRVIGVGDKLQSIYAFRGAHTESMALMQQAFNMRELGLSMTFRCPQNVVREAWWRAPHMKWTPWAKEGQVKRLEGWGLGEIPEDAAIICRNNAPLFSMAIRFLKNGRNCQIIGNDIGKGLIKAMKKLGALTTPRNQVLTLIDKWTEAQLAKSKSPRATADKADCMRLFANQGSNLAEAIAYAEHLFAQAGPVQFLTGHKAKGLEFDNVFFLDEWLVRHEQEEQEANLRYVVQTRAKQSLTYLETENFG